MGTVMEYSTSGRQLTERFEGVRLQAYQDSAGIWTIGYGHTAGVTAGQTCTEEQADAWLCGDIAWAENEVNRLVKVTLTQPEFDALVDFVFNAGAGNFESSTMLKLLNAGQFSAAATQFDLWDHAGGQVVAGLLRRREAETNEFESGE
jgi:lysozyme